MSMIPYLDAAQVHARADWGRLIDAMDEAHRRAPVVTGQLRLSQPRPDGQPDMLILAPAWDAGRALGVKLVTSFPGNPARGETTVGSIYVLFDPLTGKPAMLLDGEAMIFRKTAADSALGLRLLSRPDARCMTMLGAGALAPYVIEAACHVRPGIDEIRVWNRSPDRAEALARAARAKGLPVTAWGDPVAAQRDADVVMAATMSETPIVSGAHLAPGTHVGLIGSFTPRMREGDDPLLRRARIYVDDPSAVEKSGEFTGPLARGIITSADILGDLYDLCQRRCPFPQETEISLFKNGGASHLDLITAGVVMSAL